MALNGDERDAARAYSSAPLGTGRSDQRRPSGVDDLMMGSHGIGWSARPRAVLTLVAATLLCDYALLTVIVPVVPHYRKELGVSMTSVGLLFASKGISQLLANPVWGHAVDSLGPERPFSAGLAVLIASTVTYAFARTYPLLVVARCVQGVGSAAIMSAGMSWVAIVYAAGDRGEAMGRAMSGVGLGVMIGPVLGGLAFVGRPFREGTPFIVLAVLLTGCAALLAVVRAGRARGVALLDEAEVADTVRAAHGGGGLWAIVRDRRVALLVLGMMTADGGIALIEPIVPDRLTSRFGVANGLTGVCFIATTLAYSVSSPLVGRFGEGWNRRVSAVCGMSVMAGALVALGAADSLALFIGALALLGVGMAFVDASVLPLLAEVVEAIYPDSFGAVFALADIALSVGYIVGPLSGTTLVHHLTFFRAVSAYAGLIVVVAPLVVLAGGVPKGPAAREQQMLNHASAEDESGERLLRE